jgi:hypothetical protein
MLSLALASAAATGALATAPAHAEEVCVPPQVGSGCLNVAENGCVASGTIWINGKPFVFACHP